jgi:hypothetical protein
MDEILPLGWYVAQTLENLAMLYRRIAEDDRRAISGSDRERIANFVGDLGVRADTMDLAARIAVDAAQNVRRDLFACRELRLF